jgi:hypothetical protein
MVKHLDTIAVAYVGALACSFLGLLTLGTERLEVGCYLRDALVVGAQCSGFHGATAVSFVLNMPLNLFYAPLFGVAGLFEGPFFVESLYTLLLGALLWAPIIFLLWIRLRYRLTRHSTRPDASGAHSLRSSGQGPAG